MIRPDLRNRPRKTTVIAKRLQFLEQEHADCAYLSMMLVQDMIELRQARSRHDTRIATLSGLVGAIAAVLGAEPGTVGIWLIAMADDDATETAADLGNDLTEQILLLHAQPHGEG